MFFHELVLQRGSWQELRASIGIDSRFMIYVGPVSFWACSCYGLDKICGAMPKRKRLVDIARLLELFLSISSLWCCAETVYVFRFTDKMCHLSNVFSSLCSADDFRKGKTSGSLWSSTALIFSISSTDDMGHLSMYFVFSAVQMISGRGKHLVACDPERLSYSQLCQ